MWTGGLSGFSGTLGRSSGSAFQDTASCLELGHRSSVPGRLHGARRPASRVLPHRTRLLRPAMGVTICQLPAELTCPA